MYLTSAVFCSHAYLDIVNEFIGNNAVKLIKMRIFRYDSRLFFGIYYTFTFSQYSFFNLFGIISASLRSCSSEARRLYKDAIFDINRKAFSVTQGLKRLEIKVFLAPTLFCSKASETLFCIFDCCRMVQWALKLTHRNQLSEE